MSLGQDLLAVTVILLLVLIIYTKVTGTSIKEVIVQIKDGVKKK